MIMNVTFIVLFIPTLFLHGPQSTLGIVESKTFKEGNELFSPSINDYKKNEFWGIWSVPIGESKTSSSLPPNNENTYTSENIQDYDLNTAWMTSGIGEFIEFKLDYFPGENSKAYQFHGICNVFNGYCKSFVKWTENSRVKKMKVYFNNIPVCFVNLLDTWKFQTFDISKSLFTDKFKQISRPKNILKFEIVEIYKGTKFKDVGFSEFLCEGAAN